MSNLNLTAQWHDNINQVDVTEHKYDGKARYQ